MYVGQCQELPGLLVEGKTLDKVMQKVRDVLPDYLDVLSALGTTRKRKPISVHLITQTEAKVFA